MSTYRDWNNALWKFFFKKGNEDAILYLDSTILETIASEAQFNYDEPAGDDLLKNTLINDEQSLREFREDYRNWTTEFRFPGVDRWDKLVNFLKDNKRQIDGKPPYFAMLCAIMYLASTQGADHSKMKTLAKKYLGEGYRGKVGELIYDLMQKLHKDKNSFNPDRLVCGKDKAEQRHIGRIKYHLVLKADEYQDFIDFLEVGNLQWNEGSYADYANNILIPALHRANKQTLIDVVTSQEFFPYVKNILLSDLTWGKDSSSSVSGNIRPVKDIKWKYEMELDFDGNPSFYISTDYELPFGVRLNNLNRFEKTDEISDYMAFDVRFGELGLETIPHEGYEYCFSNLSQNDDDGDWNGEILFQQVGERYYHQVNTPLEGKHYVKLIKKGTQSIEKLTNGWSHSQIGVDGYDVYMIDSYTIAAPQSRRNNRNLVDDRFKLYGIGTWFCIHLKEGQHIYWYPDMVSAIDKDEKEYELRKGDVVSAPNGKTYFKLSRNGTGYIRGNLIVKDDKGKELLSEQIKDNFAWNGQQTKYGYNEWGESVEEGSIAHTKAQPMAHHLIPNSAADVPLSQDSNMLIQILYDIADESGCVSSTKLKDALNFVLKFYDIVPTPQNRLSLIYALRRLGYIIAYYDGKEYVNQLVAPYLERTNYSFVMGGQNNAYLVKGVYCKESLKTIINNSDRVKYKRPYKDDLLHRHPEYVCLPDFVFFTKRNERIFDGWDIVEYPIAYDYLAATANMTDFESHFDIVRDGDEYMTQEKLDLPSMVKVNEKEELCVMDSRGHYSLCKSYLSNGIYRNIPKQLSRVYCQNKHEKPIVILKTYRANKKTEIESNLVTILEQMGKPELLNIALCDLNLGMPENNYCFVVDNKSSDLPCEENRPFLFGDTYNTANSVEQVRQGLEKIGARQINDYFGSSSVFLSPKKIGYSMRIITPSEGKNCIALYEECDNMIAFSIGSQKVYVSDCQGGFKEILGNDTLNSKLSAVINHKHLNYGSPFTGKLPDFKEAQKVKIIKKHQ